MSVSKRVLIENRNLTVGDNTVVLSAVQRHVLQREAPGGPRRTDILHPSDMAKAEWCWRADYYRIKGVPLAEGTQNPSFRMTNVFEEGHEIHHKWQNWFWEMGILYGVFECRWCQQRWWDLSPKACFYCERTDFLRYREVPLEAPELHIAGHSDGGLMVGDEPFRLLEIKSLSLGTLRFEAPDLYEQYQANEPLDRIWMQINRPFPSHIRQGAMYLYLATRGCNPDVPVPKEMVFIYEWKPTQEVKEFIITYSPRWVERLIGGAQMVTDALEYGRPPPRPQWARDENVKICHGCPYRNVCWKLNHEQRDESHPPSLPVKRVAAADRRRALAR